ncbi:MAG: alanine racemase [Pedosphaera sp.]|nr:alanine racemase [Pedosphaera sp.]
MNHSYRCWAEVDLTSLRENLGWIRHRVGPDVKIMTVVKADAYGHGLKQIAALLMQSGTDVFGVANLAEAQAIRAVGRGWPVLMLGACLPEEIERAVRDDVMLTLSTLAEAKLVSAAALRLKRSVGVHIKVDTGMGRLGVATEQARELISAVEQLPGLRLIGIYTHYAAVEDDAAFAREQRRRFNRLLAPLLKAGRAFEYLHVNNSGALLLEKTTIFNTVRPGLAVYGVVPPAKRRIASVLKRHLRPALSWKCRVGLVKEVPAGTPLSYGRTFIASRPMRVATLTAGYGDGYLRSGSGQAQVLIGGKLCPVVGRITMDQMLVDISALKRVRVGDEVVLIGRQRRKEITAAQLAEWAGTIPWEVLTAITYRVPRVYLGGHAS